MTDRSFDALTRTLGRRRAAKALAAAAATPLAGVSLAGARSNNGNGQKKRKHRKQKQRIDRQSLALCAGQVTQCETLIREQCEGDPDCLAAQLPCCQELADCDFGALITCLNASTQN